MRWTDGSAGRACFDAGEGAPWVSRDRCGPIAATGFARFGAAARSDAPRRSRSQTRGEAPLSGCSCCSAVGADRWRQRPRLFRADPAGHQPAHLAERRPSVTVLAADDSLIGTFGDLFGKPLSLGEMSPYLPKAVIAAEDRRFYSHFGIDPIGIARAAMANFRAGRSSRAAARSPSSLPRSCS